MMKTKVECYEQILKNLNLGVIICEKSEDSKIIHINRAAIGHLQLKNLKPEDCTGRPLSEIFLQSEQLQESSNVLNLGRAVEYEKKIENVNLRIKANIQDSKYLVIQLENISHEKQIEAELDQQKILALQSSRLSSVGKMAGGLAHEINNPLAVILGNANLVRKNLKKNGLESEPLSNSLDRIQRGVERISKIISNLRTFARDASRDPFELSTFESIFKMAFDMCETRIKNHGINITLGGEALAQAVECRPIQLSQVIINLLNNSTDALDLIEEKWIKIECADKGDFVELSITDSGKGLSFENAKSLFTPYNTTKEVGRGDGIGLALSYSIITGHKGKMYLDQSSVNTRFVIILPKAQAQQAAA